MKKLNIIRTGIVMPLLLCLAHYSPAQTLTFTQAMDSLLAPLDKNRITTGILYERVMPMANIDLFNTTPADPFISDYSYYCQAYFELYHAAYNKAGWMKPEHLRAWAEGEMVKHNYTIGVLDYNFNMIDSNAVNNGLLSFSNGQFHDVPGAPSPYWNSRLQVAAILTDEIPSGLVTLKYNPGFIKTNQNLAISSIQLNFGSIGIFTLSPASPSVQVNFTGSGVKEFTITVQYSNGSSFSHPSEVQIGSNTDPYSSRIEGPVAEPPDVTFWISSKYSYQGTGEAQPYYAKGKVSIWWKRDANNIPVPGIKKHVIIIDGFDPKGERMDTSIYNLFKYINQNNNQDNFADELRSFGKDFDIIVMDMPGYTKDSPTTINDGNSSRPYPPTLYDNTAPDSLKGVIFGGGDYQQRNAYVLEYLIDYCNQEMQNNGSTEKIVIVGPSMGGQISRYALRDMEKRGQNHNCRLWVCFDSNNEGSYASIGVQYSISALAASSSEAAFTRGVFIDCPEAKQSLLHHYLGGTATVSGAPGFFDQYYNEVNNPSFGFPQASGLRKIAMISGSDLGVPQTFGTACQLAMRLDVVFSPRKFLANLIAIVVPLVPLLGTIIAEQKVQKIYLAPASGQCTIFDNNSVSIFANAPPWCTTSLDMTQGGHFPIFSIYKSQTDGKRSKEWYKNLFQLSVSDYMGSDVQQLTYSTLALGLGSMPDPTRKWDDNFRKDKFNQPVDVTCPETKESPFDMYWAPDINTRHDSLLLGHVVRLRKEIIDKQEWPKTQLQRTASITGNATLICPGGTANLSISNPLPGMNYQWITSNPLLSVTSGQGTPNITVSLSSSSNFNGPINVACSASSACYNINSQQYGLYTGKPSIEGTYTAPGNSSQYLQPSIPRQPCTWNDACESGLISTNMIMHPGLTISWSGGGEIPGQVTWYQQGNNLFFYFSGPDQTAVFNATSCNCGKCNNVRYCFRSVSSPSCGPPLRLQNPDLFVEVYPNPTSGMVTISLIKTSESKKAAHIHEIKIIDKMGNIRRRYKFATGSKSVNINLSELNLDVYSVLVFDGANWRSAKLVKQ